MKKFLAIIVALIIAFTSVIMGACDEKDPGGLPDGDNIGIPDGGKGETPDDDEGEDSDGDDGGEVEEVTVDGIKVFGNILTDNVILKGTELSGFEYSVCYSDGTESAKTAVDASMIGGYDKSVAGYQTVKVTYQNFEKEFEVLVADVILSDAAELEAAIREQQDDQVRVLLGGNYEVNPVDTSETSGQAGSYFALTANGLKIYGTDMLTVASGAAAVNDGNTEQSFVTVLGDNVEFHGLNFVGNADLNNVIEVKGDNFVLSDCTINASEEEPGFAGNVYFNEFAGKTATLQNVEMNYARIDASGCDSTSVIEMNDVTVNFAGAAIKDFAEEGYSSESYYWAISNVSGATIQAKDCVITVSAGASRHKEYQSAFVAYLPESGIEIMIVTEGEQENVAYVADENELVQATLLSAYYSEYEIFLTDDITWTKSGVTVLYVDGVTISLNGKTLSGANMAMVFQGNDFTIKDGTVRVLNGDSYALFVGDEEYTTGSVVENVVMEGGINVYNAQVTLKNCTISATVYYAVWCDFNAQVVIENGTYDVGNGRYVLGMGVTSSPDDGVISLTVNGGTFISENKLVLPGANNDGYPYGSPVINAGVFNDDPSAFVNNETSEITEADGKYYVTLK